MDFSIASSQKTRKTADLLVVPFWKGKKGAELAVEAGEWSSDVALPLTTHDFSGKEGEVLIIYAKERKERRIALLGLGESNQLTTEILRRAYAALTKSCNQRKIKHINILMPQVLGLATEDVTRGVVEGVLLANYTFTKHKHDLLKDSSPSLLRRATLVGADKGALPLAKKLKIICEGVHLVRDLVNSNADEVTPQYLADLASKMALKDPRLKAKIFDKQRIEKEKMGLLLAVNRGSALEPRFIILEYKGSPKAKEHTVFIGKGITYDTGGLNIKSGGMETMKCDMGGAAVALVTVLVAAKLRLPVHLTAVVPSTDNCVSARSFKPGDVYTAFTGKTVEVGNTDAEGRLVLADALGYTVKHLKPTQIIDFATLTGAIDIALGNEVTGMMSNDDALSDLFLRAGSETFERIWRLPIVEEYKDNLKSEVADIRNIGGRSASSINSAIFLQQFVGKTPWVHFDIGSTAFLSESKRYLPKGGTGVGVRLSIAFLELLLGLT